MTNLNKKIKRNRGMTYVELIVVLSIFSIMSAVSLFSYRGFQAKINIKNLTTDIAMQIVGAQKNAIAGKLSTSSFADIIGNPGKPSYGVHFDLMHKEEFIYFADFLNDGIYDSVDEGLDTIQITKGNHISELKVEGSTNCSSVTNLDIVFKRPDSSALVSANGIDCDIFSKVIITVSSLDEVAKSNIEVYPSGRIEITND